MVFSSLIFVFAFLPASLLLYYAADFGKYVFGLLLKKDISLPSKISCIPSGKQFKNAVLLCASLFFYAWGEPVYILLMIASIIFNYKLGIIIGENASNAKPGKCLLVIGIAANLGCLACFKYTGFIVDTISSVANVELSITAPVLPIGISFYTFQALSYIVDVYRGNTRAQKKLSIFALYISMFPQLIAGPIVNYRDIETQLENREISIENITGGMRRFIYGLSKKLFLANNIGALWLEVRNMPNTEMTILMSWVGICAYAFQIYYDFSGYSDMAIGLGNIFGFHFKENFNLPYTSKSITEFWQRWHISLGVWFRDYVYIPLGGNRQGKMKLIRNLFVTWALTGLWHGASWNFVLWGFYYGFIITIEKLFLLKKMACWPKAFRSLYTLFIVLIGWVFFEFTSLKDIMFFLKSMTGFYQPPFVNYQTIALARDYMAIYMACILAEFPLTAVLLRMIHKKQTALGYFIENIFCCFLLLCATANIVASTFNPFIYFRF